MVFLYEHIKTKKDGLLAIIFDALYREGLVGILIFKYAIMIKESHDKDIERAKSLSIGEYFSELVKDFLDLDKGVDKWGTIKEIKSKQSMSGANAWMLLCSIIIASIGLNLNSQAVIIGAMLISPLMSPILGIGLAIGINDKDALYHAIMHFAAAIIIALLASFIYFLFTPLKEFTEQIHARTEPTFLDVIIAIFGGIAGIISIARKDISTTLPGVAIATALMPPLCVAGYGLATASLGIALKAFYLFFLNSFFVALATYIFIRLMKFPHKEYANAKDRKKNFYIIGVFSTLMLIPSLFIFYSVYNKYKEKQKIDFFVNTYIGDNRTYLDEYKLISNQEDDTKTLVLKVYGDKINSGQMSDFKNGLAALDMEDVSVNIIPTSEINLDKFQQLQKDVSEVDVKLNAQINQLVEEREELEELIEDMSTTDNFFTQDSIKFADVCREVKIFIPEISELGLAVSQYSNFETIENKVPTVLARWEKPQEEEIKKLEMYLKQSYKLDSIKIVTY